jgi:ribosome biogenesis GTPase
MEAHPTHGDGRAHPPERAASRHISREDALPTGTVLRAISGIYDVQPDDPQLPRLVRCTLRERLRKRLVFTQSKSLPRRVKEVRRLNVVEPVVAGDRVRFQLTPTSGTAVPAGVIEDVLPRQRELTRQAVTSGTVPIGQTIVANLDQVVLVFAAASPDPIPGLIDRLLVSCESEELPAILCINKCDLGISEAFAHDLEVYERAGYAVLRTSAVTGQGLEQLRAVLQGKTSAVVGPSGVGKSTLLNALQPGLGLRVGEVSAATGKGVHTTRYAQLIPFGEGTFVADTPGLRQLGLWEVSPDDLDRYFPEFRPYLGTCRFGNCAHVDEIGCAIRAAVERGAIDARRYRSYVKMFTEEAARAGAYDTA